MENRCRGRLSSRRPHRHRKGGDITRANTKNWRAVRGQRPLDERKIAAYKRLMEAELRLVELRQRRGLSQSTVAAALAVSQPNVSRIEQEDDIYLSTLARYVAALGGHLEVRAVFDDETVTILREPSDADEPVAR